MWLFVGFVLGIALGSAAFWSWDRQRRQRAAAEALREYVETPDLPAPPPEVLVDPVLPGPPLPPDHHDVTTDDIVEVVHLDPEDERVDRVGQPLYRHEIERAIEDALRSSYGVPQDALDDDDDH